LSKNHQHRIRFNPLRALFDTDRNRPVSRQSMTRWGGRLGPTDKKIMRFIIVVAVLMMKMMLEWLSIV
jgi:hypothetical protein